MAICTLMGAAGLFLFGRHVWNASAPEREPPGITVRSEILTIYAPKALIDFAKAHPEITTNDELVRLIRQAKLNVWFAIVARNHQANGNFADVAIWYDAALSCVHRRHIGLISPVLFPICCQIGLANLHL